MDWSSTQCKCNENYARACMHACNAGKVYSHVRMPCNEDGGKVSPQGPGKAVLENTVLVFVVAVSSTNHRNKRSHPHLPITCAVGISKQHLLSANPPDKGSEQTVSFVLQNALQEQSYHPTFSSTYYCLYGS